MLLTIVTMVGPTGRPNRNSAQKNPQNTSSVKNSNVLKIHAIILKYLQLPIVVHALVLVVLL